MFGNLKSKVDLDKIAELETGPYIIRFFSKTCVPCTSMDTVLKSFSAHNPNIRIYSVDVAESTDLPALFEVRGVPTVLFCDHREVVHSFTGVTPEYKLNQVLLNWENKEYRETGILPEVEKKKDYKFIGAIALIILIFITLLIII